MLFVSTTILAQETVTDSTKNWTRKGVFTFLANQSSLAIGKLVVKTTLLEILELTTISIIKMVIGNGITNGLLHTV